ncbi:hypothetical protein A0O28_0103590 [Trichoderma guizhouense]|uniref:Uncharacterized protein n=1 Tax=Trichoderma guizhouense TaxID=1491466 RepID=A0A1T3CL30_9HYPO|nr:hypothetical protein A0O28_0103590 [Trichoderma guizhouense]
MPPPARQEFQIGWICALPIEVAAAKEMLDENFGILDEQDSNDTNSYTLGRIGKHYVAIAGLGQFGTTSATTVAINMMRTFSESLRIGLMVGIAAGIPSSTHDIRLGDIIVSSPVGACGGVIQYDMGKMVNGKLIQTGSLKSPPRSLLTALTNLQATALTDDPKYPIYIEKAISRNQRTRKSFARPDASTDRLFKVHHEHPENARTCEECLKDWEEDRSPRREIDPQIHYGIIASGNMVIKHGETRERLRQETEALCFEMEAAGLMMDFPCIIVRGICDYADSHKNDAWQGYAALAAASYAKELLGYVPAGHVSREKLVIELYHQLSDATEKLQRGFEQRAARDGEKTAKDEEKERRECHQTFKTSAYEQYKNINPNRVEGTCRWVFQNSQYRQWLESSHNDLLWISADPGCGKSVLAKSLVDGDLYTSDSVSICYFFFKDNDDQNSFTTALCAILHQLFGMQPDLLQHALPEWRKNGKNIQQEVDTLWRIFEAAISDDAFSRTICVFDALDECRPSDEAKLIKLLANFYTQSQSLNRPNWIKFLVTSRPYLEIQEGFHSATKSFPRIHIRGEEENEQIHDEINLIVGLRVRELGHIEGLETQTLQRIEKQLLQMEHRTYLWLQLAMDDIRIMLRDSLRPEEERIQLIPSSVDAAYDKILNRAPPARQLEVKMILQIIVGARRPLKIKEMAVALGVGLKVGNSADLRSAATSGLKVEGFAKKIRHLCGLFVFIDKSKRIFLIHQTAREFLINISSNDERIPASPNLQFKEVVSDRVRKWYHTTLTEANFLLFKICLAYLTAEEFNNGSRALYRKNDLGYLYRERDEVRRRFSQYLFLDYSLDEWENHAGASSSSPPKDLLDLANKLNISPILRDLWLMKAAGMGQKDITKMLLENGADANIQDPRGQAPLWWAVRERRMDIAILLLDNGANIEILDPGGRTPLWIAAEMGDADMVKLLVTMGADINATAGSYGRTALQEAFFLDREPMVKLLIELGADIDAQERIYNASMLWLAANLQLVDTVRLLIKLGANVDAKDGRWGLTPLSRAIQTERGTMVKLLVELGADIEAKESKWGLTPLLRAVKNGRGTMVKLLVELGADIEAKEGRRGLTPLSWAALKNEKEIVELLIELHADIESKDEQYGRPPLWWAVLGGDEGIVKLLVEMGANTKSKDKWGNTILPWAACLPREEKMVKLLVELGCTDGQE